MKIVFIGAGNLATNLAKALKKTGMDILQIYSRTETSAKALASIVGCDYVSRKEDIITTAECYIFSVKDSVLKQLIADIVKGDKADKLFIHTAGSIPLDVFEGFAKNYGVIYPMQTFSKQREVSFENIPIFIEGNNVLTLNVIKSLMQIISKKVVILNSEKRKQLHLAAVFACNFTNHCYAVTAKILEDIEMPFSLMLPLIQETANKVAVLSPLDAQTGPAIRYDENIIRNQALLLGEEQNLKELYLALSKDIYKFAQDNKKIKK